MGTRDDVDIEVTEGDEPVLISELIRRHFERRVNHPSERARLEPDRRTRAA